MTTKLLLFYLILLIFVSGLVGYLIGSGKLI